MVDKRRSCHSRGSHDTQLGEMKGWVGLNPAARIEH